MEVIPPDLHGTNSQSPESIDLGIEQSSETGHPTVLIAPELGGIVPIFKQSNVAITKAPETGYVNNYKLNFNEKGFFVRCRDGKTYARLTIFSREYDYSVPFKNGYIKDYGIMFNAELQTEGREFNSSNSMRLDFYILENL